MIQNTIFLLLNITDKQKTCTQQKNLFILHARELFIDMLACTVLTAVYCVDILLSFFQQLMSRLNCFVLRPAAVPIRLQDPEDEEIPEEIETDELMRSLAPKQMVAPRFRWRRSRWLRNCPVALYEGDITPGKPEFAVRYV